MLFFSLPVFSSGEGMIEQEQRPDADFPVTRVNLFTAGLAQMVHETEVDGNQVIEFPVDPKDINDILKSLNVEDLDGGTVDVINFDSTDPLNIILGDYRINPSGSPALMDFLRRSQGESVTVTVENEIYRGRIFSIETAVKSETSRIILNLFSAGSIIPADITDLSKLRFDDSLLQAELESALSLIAESRLKSMRTLKLSFRGEGKRRVRLSYIKAVPLWKTSYRIILDEDGLPRLEGWAIVQNTGGSAWTGVELSFIAGRPNAFTMDLSTPRWVTRQRADIAGSAPIGATSYEKAYAPQAAPSRSREAYSEAPSALMDDYPAAFEEERYVPQAIAPQAGGVREGNFYRYDLRSPVTVDARSSAMIPILSVEAAGTSLAVYDPAYNTVFKGIMLENKTDGHWSSGPVTVTEGRFYGGDALLPEMIPGSSRLLTFAEHGTLEVEKSISDRPQKIISLKISDGLLYRTDKITRDTVYRIMGDDNELLIIHPKQYGWKLASAPDVSEENNSEYRFRLSDWSGAVTVSEEYIISNQFSLTGFRENDIGVYLSWDGISAEMKAALTDIARLRKELEEIRAELNSLGSRLSRIEREQNRIRENMKVLDKDSDLFRQYTDTFSSQEEEINRINGLITGQQQQLSAAERALRDYISGLNL